MLFKIGICLWSNSFIREEEARYVSDDIQSDDSAIEVAKAYANEECVGELGEIIDARREESERIVKF